MASNCYKRLKRIWQGLLLFSSNYPGLFFGIAVFCSHQNLTVQSFKSSWLDLAETKDIHQWFEAVLNIDNDQRNFDQPVIMEDEPGVLKVVVEST